eukprot:13705332-Alexandrium_andersonii.AAC.1
MPCSGGGASLGNAEAMTAEDYEDARVTDSGALPWGRPDGYAPWGPAGQEGSPYHDATAGAGGGNPIRAVVA